MKMGGGGGGGRGENIGIGFVQPVSPRPCYSSGYRCYFVILLVTAVTFVLSSSSCFSTHSVGYRRSINQSPFSSESKAINMYRY